MPNVSVVIPAYNREKVIGSAIRSVLGQTFGDFEVLVVDDHSTDSTVAAVEQFAKDDARVRLLTNAGQKGAQGARNTGIRNAQGHWIAFLDSDDQYLPQSLANRLALAEQAQVDVVHTECRILRAGDDAGTLFGIPPMQGQIYSQVLSRPGPMFQGLLVAKTALEAIGYLDESIIAYQEWDTSIRLAKDNVFAFLPEPTFIYDCRNEGTISKNAIRGAQGYAQVISKHRGEILRHAGLMPLARHYESAAKLYRDAGDLAQAQKYQRLFSLLWPVCRVLNKVRALTRRS